MCKTFIKVRKFIFMNAQPQTVHFEDDLTARICSILDYCYFLLIFLNKSLCSNVCAFFSPFIFVKDKYKIYKFFEWIFMSLLRLWLRRVWILDLIYVLNFFSYSFFFGIFLYLMVLDITNEHFPSHNAFWQNSFIILKKTN